MNVTKFFTLLIFFQIILFAVIACGSGGGEQQISRGPDPEVQAPPRVTPLSIAAEQLQPGQSIKLTTNGLVEQAQQPEESSNILQWGSTGAWDPIRHRGVWIGKRHTFDYPYHRIEYDETTNTWVEESDPLNGENVLGHGYDHMTVDPDTGNIYFRPYNSSAIYKWTRTTDTWAKYIDIPGSTQVAEALEYWWGIGPTFSDVYGVRRYDESSGTWSTLVSRSEIETIGYHSTGEYQPTGDMYIFGGGNANSSLLYKIDSSGTLTELPEAPFALGNAPSQGLLAFDPGSEMIIAWDHDNLWYELDPVNETWTQLAVSTGDGTTAQEGPPNFPAVTQHYPYASIAIPIPEYNIIMFLRHSTNDVWLYKHSE